MYEIKRKISQDIKKHLDAREITMLVGPRQAGKTTLLRQIQKEIKSAGQKTLFLNLDIEKDSVHFKSQESLIRKIRLEIGDTGGIVFMDEIQRKPNAGLFLKGLYDMDLPYKFVVSGSGSLELKSKMRESLAGRKRMFELFPVSFAEFADFRTGYRYTDHLAEYMGTEKQTARGFLDEYLHFGGYPRVVTETILEDKRRILEDLFRSYIEKDIVFLLGVERPDAYGKLIRLLASHTGRLLNFSSLAAATALSGQTVRTYLWYAEQTFILAVLTPFSRNKTKEITKSPVPYFTDLGFRNHSLGFTGSPVPPSEYGFLFQNWVYTILVERAGRTGERLGFWRTTDKAEVDFVLDGPEGPLPVEVKHVALKKQEMKRSLRSFIGIYHPREAWVVNLELDGECRVDSTRVRFLPWYKLL